MNYFKQYYCFIAENKVSYAEYGDKLALECHHIIPKSLGGPKTDKSNLVWLSHDNHVLAHMLLNLAMIQHKMVDDAKLLSHPFSSDGINLLEKHGYLDSFKVLVGSSSRHKAKNLIVSARGFANKAIYNDHIKIRVSFDAFVYKIAAKLLSRLQYGNTYDKKQI